jgi:predicted TIM-barrel fold metal-dependent hydrolase
VTRRSLLLSSLAASGVGAAQPAVPVLDTHIHLFDPTRPGGVPWPSKNDGDLYRPALPPRLRALAEPFGVRGAIEIECSPLVEDNQWVLDVAQKDPFIVGMVGNLEPAAPEFPKQLDSLRKNPLFLGIRYGNLWGRNLATQLDKPEFVAGLRRLAGAGMVMDTANPNADLLRAVLRATELVSGLRVVIDHLPRLVPAPKDLLKDLAARPGIFAKLSGVLRREGGRVPLDAPFYRDTLDGLFELFGEDRVLYGSDWPNSDRWGTYTQGFEVVRQYFAAKGKVAAEKYFWKNSLAAYRWKPRDSGQKLL